MKEVWSRRAREIPISRPREDFKTNENVLALRTVTPFAGRHSKGVSTGSMAIKSTLWRLHLRSNIETVTRTFERCLRRGVCFGGPFAPVSRPMVVRRHVLLNRKRGLVELELRGSLLLLIEERHERRRTPHEELRGSLSVH